MVNLYPHQRNAVEKMKNGCILVGGVGTGKSKTSLAYYVEKVLAKGPSPLFVITTARKRDTLDWEKEAEGFDIPEMHVDSWNNIKKYIDIENAFFIFDEQRIIGNGVWVKSFLKIARKNQWVLLSATPGDTWMDYVPVFIANGFYKNRTEFMFRHVIFDRFSKFPKVAKYIDVETLVRHRKEIVVNMIFQKKTKAHNEVVWVPFDKSFVKQILTTRWNPFKFCPIQDAGGLCYVLRRAVNSDGRRIAAVETILSAHPKVVIFYNFDYELDLLRAMAERLNVECKEWNGKKHEPVPDGDQWIYLVQYTAGCEGWNCTQTDTMIFFSLNYSYRVMTQASGRIDRMNTPFTDLYYYQLCSHSGIDLAIRKAILEKRVFNESMYAKRL